MLNSSVISVARGSGVSLHCWPPTPSPCRNEEDAGENEYCSHKECQDGSPYASSNVDSWVIAGSCINTRYIQP